MNNNKHKIVTLAALTAVSAGVIHLANRIIAASAQLKEMLDMSSNHYFDWRFGKIFYTKRGTGSPILLVHDTAAGGSGYEWNRIEKELAMEHTVYTIDLLGCGRSDKPGITYTNFLFVQLLCDFTKKVIKERTDVIASGFSSSFAVMSCLYEKDCFHKLMLVNPPSLKSLNRTPAKRDNIFKFLIELPIFGTLIYHMIVSRETINTNFLDDFYHNPFHVDQDLVDSYYEAAHKGGYYAKYFYSSLASHYINIPIGHALKKLNNSIYIVQGEEEPNMDAIASEYCKLNPAIELAAVKECKHFPHIENRDKFLDVVGDFF